MLQNGKRFVNEAGGYYDYVDAMVKAVPAGEEVCSWLVCTHRFQRRYGLGISRPAPVPFKHWIKQGYLKTGKTLGALATECGIDPQALKYTVDNYNRHARQGDDPAFGRGSTPYNRKTATRPTGQIPVSHRLIRGHFMPSKYCLAVSAPSPDLKPMRTLRCLTLPTSPSMACMRRVVIWPASWAASTLLVALTLGLQ